MQKVDLTNERINAQGGLFLIGHLLNRLGDFGELPSLHNREHRSDRFSNRDILVSAIGLMVQGRSHYEDIELFRDITGTSNDAAEGSKGGWEYFASALGISRVPSKEALRQRLRILAGHASASSGKVDPATKLRAAEMGQEISRQIDAMNLALIQGYQLSPLTVDGRKYISCDIDVSPFDNTGSKRENIGRTYKGCDGFAPIMAYIGTEGWLIHHKLRPGVQHCQKETPEFLRDTLKRIASLSLSEEVLIRMDSGNDSADNIAILRESEHRFIVKRNLRKESREGWLSHAKATGEIRESRAGKKVYIGTLEHKKPGGENSTQDPLTIVYEVTERHIDEYGQALLIPEIEVHTWWTNLGESPEEIIGLYHDHATSEQFHSELKGDLNLERFPSYDYKINQLWLLLGTLAYNLLRSLWCETCTAKEKAPQKWPKGLRKVKRRRLGSLIRDMILVACKVVRHAGREVLKLPRSWPWSEVMLAIDIRLRAG